MDPSEIGDYLENLISEGKLEEAAAALAELAGSDINLASEVVEGMSSTKAARIINEMDSELAGRILENVDSNKAAKIFNAPGNNRWGFLPYTISSDKAGEILASMDPDKAAEVLSLVAGGNKRGVKRAASILEAMGVGEAANIIASDNMDAETAALILGKMDSAKVGKIFSAFKYGLDPYPDLSMRSFQKIVPPEKAGAILSAMGSEKAAEVLSSMRPRATIDIIRAMLKNQGAQEVGKIMGLMNPEDAAAIMAIPSELSTPQGPVGLSVDECVDILKAMDEEKAGLILDELEKINPDKAIRIKEGLELPWWGDMEPDEIISYLKDLISQGKLDEAVEKFEELIGEDLELASDVIKNMGADSAAKIFHTIDVSLGASVLKELASGGEVDKAAEILFEVSILGGPSHQASSLLDAMIGDDLNAQDIALAKDIVLAFKELEAGYGDTFSGGFIAPILGHSNLSEDKAIAIMKAVDKEDRTYVNQILAWMPPAGGSQNLVEAYNQRAVNILIELAKSDTGYWYRNAGERLSEIASYRNGFGAAAILDSWAKDNASQAAKAANFLTDEAIGKIINSRAMTSQGLANLLSATRFRGTMPIIRIEKAAIILSQIDDSAKQAEVIKGILDSSLINNGASRGYSILFKAVEEGYMSTEDIAEILNEDVLSVDDCLSVLKLWEDDTIIDIVFNLYKINPEKAKEIIAALWRIDREKAGNIVQNLNLEN